MRECAWFLARFLSGALARTLVLSGATEVEELALRTPPTYGRSAQCAAERVRLGGWAVLYWGEKKTGRRRAGTGQARGKYWAQATQPTRRRRKYLWMVGKAGGGQGPGPGPRAWAGGFGLG